MSATNMYEPTTATLAITSTCPHCPALISGFSQLLKQGKLAHLELVNIEQDPSFAERNKIRGVPWFRIASLDFEGAYKPSELAWWVENGSSEAGIRRYLSERLEQGQLQQASSLVEAQPHTLALLLPLLADDDTPMQVRIGIGALFEQLEGEDTLQSLMPQLIELLQDSRDNVRIDACHLLSLLHAQTLTPTFKACLKDSHPEVREIAREALQALQNVP